MNNRSISFVLDKEPGKEDARLRMRVKYGDSTTSYMVGYRVNHAMWVNKAQRCKPSSTHGKKRIAASVINKEIQRHEDVANEVLNLFEAKKITPTEEAIKTEINSRLGKNKKRGKWDIFENYNEFIETQSVENSWQMATIKKHKTMLNHLRNFSPNLEYEDLTEKGLNALVNYLLSLDGSQETLKNSTTKKYIATIKWFLRWATAKKYNTNMAFVNFAPKLKTIPNHVIFLDWEELMQLYRYEIPTMKRQLNSVRDKFLFSCFTGLRHSDVEALTWENIKENHIDVVTIKTNDRIKIELNNYSRELLSRYERGEGKVFPPMTNQKMNKNLKILGEMAGINTPVMTSFFCKNKRIEDVQPKYMHIATHTARRTFICNALMLGISPNIVMKWTGHSTYNAMRPYIDIADKAKESAMELFNR